MPSIVDEGPPVLCRHSVADSQVVGQTWSVEQALCQGQTWWVY